MKISRTSFLYRAINAMFDHVATDSCNLLRQIVMLLVIAALGAFMFAGLAFAVFAGTGQVIGEIIGHITMQKFDGFFMDLAFFLALCAVWWMLITIYIGIKYERLIGEKVINSVYEFCTKDREPGLIRTLAKSFFSKVCFKIEHV